MLALPVDGRVWNVDMDDWMFLIDEQTVLNRTTMSKFGFAPGRGDAVVPQALSPSATMPVRQLLPDRTTRCPSSRR